MRAEIVRRDLQRLFPTGDSLGQRPVDVLESLFGGGVASLANPVEDPPGDRLLLGLVAKECVFERDMLVRRIQTHGFRELVARAFVVADFEQHVGQILVDGRATGRKRNGLPESGDGLIVAFRAKRSIGLLQGPVGGIGILAVSGGPRQSQDEDDSYHRFTYMEYRCSGVGGEVISTIQDTRAKRSKR